MKYSANGIITIPLSSCKYANTTSVRINLHMPVAPTSASTIPRSSTMVATVNDSRRKVNVMM